MFDLFSLVFPHCGILGPVCVLFSRLFSPVVRVHEHTFLGVRPTPILSWDEFEVCRYRSVPVPLHTSYHRIEVWIMKISTSRPRRLSSYFLRYSCLHVLDAGIQTLLRNNTIFICRESTSRSSGLTGLSCNSQTTGVRQLT